MNEIRVPFRFAVVVVLLLLTLVALPTRALAETAQAPAAAGAAPPPVTLSLRDVPLRTAVQTLFEGSGLQHAVESAVPNYPITLDIRDVAFNTALRILLRLAPRVTYRKEGEVYLIGMSAPPAETIAAVPDIQPPAEPAAAESQSVKVQLNFIDYSVVAALLGARSVPTEAELKGGAGGMGGMGSSLGGQSGGFGGQGSGLGGLSGGLGSGLSGYGGGSSGLGGYGSALGTGQGTGNSYVGPTARRF